MKINIASSPVNTPVSTKNDDKKISKKEQSTHGSALKQAAEERKPFFQKEDLSISKPCQTI